MSTEQIKFHSHRADIKTGKFFQLEAAINLLMDRLEFIDVLLVKDAFNFLAASGSDLDAIAAYFGIVRRAGEDGETLIGRMELHIRSRVSVTVDAIQDVFEFITGLRPKITEDFVTQVYTSGMTKGSAELGTFSVAFNVDITTVTETLRVNSDGLGVTVGHTTNINDSVIETETDGISLAQATSNFTSAGAAFQTKGVTINDILFIDTGSSLGRYKITDVVDNNTLTIVPQPVADTVLTYRVVSSFSAWDKVVDPTHQTDIADTLTASTSIMTLTNTPYVPDTLIDVQYEITPIGDYDTIVELSENLELFESLLDLTRLAGVKTDEILLTKFFTAWFQDGGTERLVITDLFFIDNIHFLEQFIDIIAIGFDKQIFDYDGFDRPDSIVFDLLQITANGTMSFTKTSDAKVS